MQAAVARIAGYMLIKKDRASVVQLATTSALTMDRTSKYENIEDVKDGLGHSFTRRGESKLGFVHQKGTTDQVYVAVIYHFSTNIFNSLTKMSANAFETLFRKVDAMTGHLFDAQMSTVDEEVILQSPKKHCCYNK